MQKIRTGALLRIRFRVRNHDLKTFPKLYKVLSSE